MILQILKKHWLELVFLLIILALSARLVFQTIQRQTLNGKLNEQRIEAQNEIARLSTLVQETEGTWSRLAQQRQDQIEQLREQNSDLAQTIESRDERIQNLTRITARLRDIHISGPAQEVPVPEQPGRLRVNFVQDYEDVLRIDGYTLTNPAEFAMQLSFLRPINFTVVTTQREDGSWVSYVNSDWSILQIGQIESSVNPLPQPSSDDEPQWYDGAEIAIQGAVATSGNAGYLGLNIGWDFNNFLLGVNLGGMIHPTGGEFMVGAYLGLHPFNL